MIIDVPEGKEPIGYVWGEMVPGIGPAAAAFSMAVYEHTTLGLREFEAARLRIAQVNGCLFCLDWRTERDGVKVEDGFDAAVARWRTAKTAGSAESAESAKAAAASPEAIETLDERTRLAAEYAERYALDHHNLDGAFWARMLAAYSQAEVVELTMCLGSWLAFGRLNRVLGIDAVCVVPHH